MRRSIHQAFLSALLIAVVTWVELSQTTTILTAIGEPSDLAREAGRYMLGVPVGSRAEPDLFRRPSVFAALERPRPTLIAGLIAAASTHSPITR